MQDITRNLAAKVVIKETEMVMAMIMRIAMGMVMVTVMEMVMVMRIVVGMVMDGDGNEDRDGAGDGYDGAYEIMLKREEEFSKDFVCLIPKPSRNILNESLE